MNKCEVTITYKAKHIEFSDLQIGSLFMLPYRQELYIKTGAKDYMGITKFEIWRNQDVEEVTPVSATAMKVETEL